MAKYTQKIKNILEEYDIHTNISFNQSHDHNNNKSINNIIDSINVAHNHKPNINHTKTSILSRLINTNKSNPLMYTYLNVLQKNNMFYPKHINVSNIPNCDNSQQFINWYDTHSKDIPLHRINDYIKQYIDNDNNNKSEIHNIYKQLYEQIQPRKHLHERLYTNSFISLDVQKDIEMCDLVYDEYEIDSIHQVRMYVPNITKKNDIPKIKMISFIITFFDDLHKKYRPNTNVVVDLTIILSRQKKLIDFNTNVLSAKNINSGSTYPGIQITCWRKEELYKVLIHELFHYYNFDFHSSDHNYDNAYNRLTIAKINGVDKINESYTEPATIVIFTLMISYIESKNKNNNVNINNIMKLFKQNIQYEVDFLMFQLSKFILFFGGNSFDEYDKEYIKFNQTTSVRSYFVIKLFILANLNVFITFMDHSMLVNNNRIHDYVDLINKSREVFINRKNNNIIDLIIEKLKKHNNKEGWIYDTSRMSYNDLQMYLDLLFND